MGKLSQAKRRRMMGEYAYREMMRKMGKKGGRPRKKRSI
jgi:hypothetical protein